MTLDKSILVKLWPHANSALTDGIVDSSTAVFDKYEINTPLRLAHFMAQISHESDGGIITEENMNYTTASRIAAVWPSRFTPETAQAYVRNPRALANKVYNGRMGNAPNSDDGYNYRGRGLLQITGKESYENIGNLTGLDLVKNPGMAFAPQFALEVAACEFKYLKCLPACDEDDIRTVTRRVNGGYIGIDSRRAWLAKWKLAIPDLPGELPKTDEEINEIDKPLPREAEGDKSPTKPLEKSKTIWGGIIGWLASMGSSFVALFQKLDNPYTLTAFIIIVLIATVALILVIKGRIDVNKVVKELSGDVG